MKMLVRSHAIVYVLERDYLPKVEGIAEVFSIVETIIDSLVEEIKTKYEWDIFEVLNKLETEFKPHQCEYTNCVLSSIRQGLLGMTGNFEVEYTGSLCLVCKEPQFKNLGSVCCINGHVGAAGIESKIILDTNSPLDSDPLLLKSKEIELKFPLQSCPFCGKHPYIVEGTTKLGTANYNWVQVQCNCGARGSAIYSDNAIEKSVNNWNTRQSSIC